MDNDINTDKLQTQKELRTQNDFFIFEIDLFSEEEIQSYLEKLSLFCQDFNPFEARKLSTKDKKLLKELGLSETLDNPFTFTNRALKLLDQLETKIKKQ